MINEEKPLVTVVTVTYNLIKSGRKEYFRQCVESVHSQSYENIEHLIIDGGSNDGSVELIKEYADKGWIKYISEPDDGIYFALNKGIKMAKGKYIVFLHSDDYFHDKHGVEESVKVLEESGADFSYAPARIEKEDGTFLEGDHPYFNPAISKVFFSMPFCHQTMFTKRDVIIKEDMFNTKFKSAGDYDLILRLCLKKYKSAYVRNEFATFRLGGFSSLDTKLSHDEVSQIYFDNFEKLLPIKKKECDYIFDHDFSGISPQLAEKLKKYKPYFNYEEYKKSILKYKTIYWFRKIFSVGLGSRSTRILDLILPNILIWLTITLVFAFIQINQSLRQGQLSLPPSYDDVSYFNDALERLNIFYDQGFSGLISNYANHPPHSPVSTLLAFFGFLVLGIRDWVPAFMNSIMILLVLIFFDYLSRGLNTGWKILIAITSLTWLLMGHAVIEFRPDIFCGLITAMIVILIAEKSWLNATIIRYKVLGMLFGLALIIKPVIFPVTGFLLLSAIILNILTDKFLYKTKISFIKAIAKSKIFIFYSLIVSLPYYIFGLKDTVKYIYQNQFVDLVKIWGMTPLPFLERINYYLSGQGGAMMMKNWLYLWLFLAIVSCLILIVEKSWKKYARLLSLGVTIFLSYLIVTLSDHKTPFLGVIFDCFLFFTSIQMLIFIIKKTDKLYNYYRYLAAMLVIIFCGYAFYTFEWPASNDLNSPNPKKLSERRYHGELLKNVYDDIINNVEEDKVRFNKKNTPKIYFSILSHWIHRDSFLYNNLKSGDIKIIVNDGSLKVEMQEQMKDINNSDYIIAMDAPSKNSSAWLPASKYETKIIEYLKNSADFKLFHEYTFPNSDDKIYVYLRIIKPENKN